MDTKVNTDGIIYVPQSDTYKIRVGKRTAEIPARTFKRSWNVRWAESVLRGTNNAAKKDLLEVILNFGGRPVDDPLDNVKADNNEKLHSSAWDSLYRQLEPNDPTDTLYRGMPDPADTMVACMDLPEPKPYYDPSAAPTVYHYNRFPSVPASTIISEAIKLLNAKKNLNLSITTIDQVFEGFKLMIYSDTPVARGLNETSVVLIKHAAFDRAYKTDIDMYAGLKAKLDTDTYIKLRIAFLLYEALKTSEYDKQQMNSDIFEIIYSDRER